ncbi:polyketide cyclase [Salinicola sp. MH3R3-1]|uniref:nuclear transport factor 2 family protein n=1 Tax=Salinicola sp. MH3R3-1 TaxID=1928762 RepID=UPI00094EB329|nr:nuclear transport factor 2 family protein [Salinicola sp. MH3R3-1]OLO09187.1 polyketide cyclase [Salinicola sp. MH3R3-1]
MSLSLPHAIATYFSISNGGDDARLDDCFTQDACVNDEEETHQGAEAIHVWLRAARDRFAYRVEPVSISRQGDTIIVNATVTGTFPGSPVRLDHTFQLVDAKIRSLEIH